MHPFAETISIAGGVAAAIVGAIIVLTLFYRGLSWLSGAGVKLGTIDVRGVLKSEKGHDRDRASCKRRYF